MPVEGINNTVHSINLSLVISVAALALAVLSPILSSIISGIFRLKERAIEIEAEKEKRNQEFYEQHKAEVIEKYINTIGKFSRFASGANQEAFGESMGEIYLYVDESLWPLLDSIANKINKNNPGNPSNELIQLCKALSANGIRAKN